MAPAIMPSAAHSTSHGARRPTGFRAVLHGVLIAMTVSTAVFAAPAQAEPVARIAVSYRDLDLTRADDLRVLRRRVATAARTVCAPTRHLPQSCMQSVLRNTRPQIEQAMVRQVAIAAALGRAALTR